MSGPDLARSAQEQETQDQAVAVAVAGLNSRQLPWDPKMAAGLKAVKATGHSNGTGSPGSQAAPVGLSLPTTRSQH